MSSITVTFVQPDGVEKVVSDAVEGETLMDVAKANDVEGILGDCGGSCACGTCHIYVDGEWQEVVGAPDDIEEMTLDMIEGVEEGRSRLSCQVTLNPKLDGLKVTVAPFE